jgi:glutathione S-transferase
LERRIELRLYYSPGACSLAPHIIAREAGVTVDLVRVDLVTKTTDAGEEYRTINPKGSIPALLLADGSVLTEGPVISQFIADLSPEARLIPPVGTLARYRTLEWLNFVATELHKGFSPLWRKETPDEFRAITTHMLAMKFDFLEAHLADREYLLAEGFCVADAYAFTILSWAPVVGIDLAEWPKTTAYIQRIAARAQVREALKAEGLLDTVPA